MATIRLTQALCTAASLCSAIAQTSVLYQTSFERAEGYDPAKDLAGQLGWVMQGTGGNGLIDGLFPGFGQQGYIGFMGPTDTNAFTSVWHPVDFDPVPANYPLVKFSVKMQINPSTRGADDDFRWSIYNKSGDRLFSIDFETSTLTISYVLQDGNFVPTAVFAFGEIYDLDVWMDFRRNSWSAYLNDTLIANSQPITQMSSALNFGDADAVWFLRGTTGAGDNYMAFDDYRITAEVLPSIPGFLEVIGMTNGLFNFTAYGQTGLKYSVDVTTDFVQWFSLGEFDNTDGVFEFEDTTSNGYPRGFYRLRQIP